MSLTSCYLSLSLVTFRDLSLPPVISRYLPLILVSYQFLKLRFFAFNYLSLPLFSFLYVFLRYFTFLYLSLPPLACVTSHYLQLTPVTSLNPSFPSVILSYLISAFITFRCLFLLLVSSRYF